jgi:hypothetical protein
MQRFVAVRLSQTGQLKQPIYSMLVGEDNLREQYFAEYVVTIK